VNKWGFSANLQTVSHFWDEGSGEEAVACELVQPQMRDACPSTAFPALERVREDLLFLEAVAVGPSRRPKSSASLI
jgi:hypothetical protein